MSTENEKAYNVLADMALLMSYTQQVAEIGEQQDDLETLERAFLCSNFADNFTLRNSILVILDQVKEFYNLLAKHQPDDVRDALLTLQKNYNT